MTNRFLKSSALLPLMLILFGCGSNKESAVESLDLTQMNPVASTQVLAQVQPSIQFDFVTKQQADEVLVELWLENPEKKSIHSAEAWLTFNPKKMEVKTIHYTEDFPLLAPYDQPVNSDQGILKIGAATLEEVSRERVKFAEITLSKQEGVAFLGFFDPTKHASVNMVMNKQTYNLLKFTDSPALILP